MVDIGYACFEIPKFCGQEEEFTGWLSKMERVFACCILNDQEKFKVLFQDWEVVHFNGVIIISLREERKEKWRWELGRNWV